MEEAFVKADAVWLGPIYRGDRIPEHERLDRAQLVGMLQGKDVAAAYSDAVPDMAEAVWNEAHPGDVVLILSNGAFGGIYKIFREKARKG